MKTKNYHIPSFIGIIIISLLVFIVFGSPEVLGQSHPGMPPFPLNPDPAPIDGGLGLLAAAGGTYALKKLRDKKKAKDTGL